MIQETRIEVPEDLVSHVVEGQPVIEADVDNVTDTERGTTIAKNGAKVSTIEHVLAALAGMELDNVLMEVNGPEVPIMDGSAKPFMDVLDKEGKVAVFLTKGSISLIKLPLYLRIVKSIPITYKLLPMLLVLMIYLS